MILGLIFAAIFVIIGVNLMPGINTTIATITTPTYSTGVTGMTGVILIVFAAIKRTVATRSNLSWKMGRIAGNLSPFGYGNQQPSRENSIIVSRKVQRLGVELAEVIRPHKHPTSLSGMMI